MNQKRLCGYVSARARQWLTPLLPNHCYLCGEYSRAFLCDACSEDLPSSPRACPGCALPIPSDGEAPLCGDCLKHPKPFSCAIAALDYAHPVDYLINRFKHHRHFACGEFLGARLYHHLAHLPTEPRPDLLVPVPLHWTRMLQRGFNQSDIIASHVSRRLNLRWARACRRVAANRRQQGLDRRRRLRNLRTAFAVTRDVSGLHLALVDDVMTTGATVTELARSLTRAGAARVDVWVVARVPSRA